MTQPTLSTVLLFTPVVVGGVVAALNTDSLNDMTERLEGWTRKRQQLASSGGAFGKYAINPLLWAVVKFCDWTDGFAHRGLKSGARVAVTLYLVAVWLVVLFTALKIIVMVAIGIAVLYVAVKVLASGNDNVNRGYEAGRSVFESDRGRESKGRPSGLFSSECSSCGSKEHATRDCPHGIFSSACGSCGSRNHATADCPHGVFSTACASCGSKDHATGDCPHGIFSSACESCGSRNHATADCPHGVFSSACGVCGSKDHATSDCPH